MSKDQEFFDTLKQSVVTESNRIRADPVCYIPILEEYITFFRDNNILAKPNQTPIETYEGPHAYEEAIKFLKKQKPVPTLTYDVRLYQAALDHAKDIGPKGLYSHESTDGKNASERIDKYCEWETACCENIDLGAHSGVDVIVSLLVDDGIEKRLHREHLFREEFTHFGVAAAAHKDYETIVVINYVGGIRDLGRPFFNRETYKYEYPCDLNLGTKAAVKKERKLKSSYQLQDEDAPDGTIEVKMKKAVRLYDGKKNKVTRKYYTLENGTHHVVEVEEI
jgi:uncharacterized protein YkwD